MTHGDDKGLVLPPKIAPIQIVIVPILFEKTKEITLIKCIDIMEKLKKYHSVHIDERDEHSSGWKFNEWELKGIPLRIEIGPKDLDKNQVVIVRRDTGKKTIVKEAELLAEVQKELDDMQKHVFEKAKKQLHDSTKIVDSMNELVRVIQDKKLAKALFCGNSDCEAQIKEKTDGATSRVFTLDKKGHIKKVEGNCINCNKPALGEVYFSRSY